MASLSYRLGKINFDVQSNFCSKNWTPLSWFWRKCYLKFSIFLGKFNQTPRSIFQVSIRTLRLSIFKIWGILKLFFSAPWVFHVYSCLSECRMPWYFKILGDIWNQFFPAVWAFHVYSCLSGCGMPKFFFGPTFFYFGTLYFFKFLGILFENIFSSCLGISCLPTHFWVDVECPVFFLARRFPILGLGIFSNIWGYSKILFPAVWASKIIPRICVPPLQFINPVFM